MDYHLCIQFSLSYLWMHSQTLGDRFFFFFNALGMKNGDETFPEPNTVLSAQRTRLSSYKSSKEDTNYSRIIYLLPMSLLTSVYTRHEMLILNGQTDNTTWHMCFHGTLTLSWKVNITARVKHCVSHCWPYNNKNDLFLMGESKQVEEGMLLSCPRRWAGLMTKVKVNSSQPCTSTVVQVKLWGVIFLYTPILSYIHLIQQRIHVNVTEDNRLC